MEITVFDSYSLWIMGTAATFTCIFAAAVSYAYYTYLRSKLPQAVKKRKLEDAILKLENDYIDQKRKKKELKKKVDLLQQEKREIELEVEDARAWMKKHEDDLRNLPRKKAEVERVNKKLDEKQAELAEKRQKLKEIQQERLDEEKKMRDYKNEASIEENRCRRLENESEELGTKVDNLRERRNSLQSDLESLEHERNQVQNRLDDLRTKLDDVKEQHDRERQKASQKRQRAQELDGQIGSKTAELEALDRKIENYENLAQEASEQVGEIRKLGEPADIDLRLQDFRRPAIKLEQDERRGREVSEREAFKRFEKHVEEAGFVFPSRTLRSFHTSLKISDMSPLVVLAGISGTGKSQLPRLYADAMGIHFLNVSVQPRWDAPQDLFGFYNYMEDRYKATELSRALRQMDKHNWPAKKEEDDEVRKMQKTVQDGMLLVLLDEMNLARVEYYFSELLSKLEMRPSRKHRNPKKRRDAEIEIELGSLEETDEPANLYVGHNVLFAGTMNEDETTQALSDKVIDRSNVLRFGKPDEMDTQREQGMPDGVQEYIPYDQWMQWCDNDIDRDVKERLKSVTKRANRALEKIDRPFGYRLQHALEEYVCQYPEWASNWVDDALCDQMEQKIIPKLQGVSRDISPQAGETLEELEDIIRDLDDDDLVEAYQKAQGKTVFQWTGVNRS